MFYTSHQSRTCKVCNEYFKDCFLALDKCRSRTEDKVMLTNFFADMTYLKLFSSSLVAELNQAVKVKMKTDCGSFHTTLLRRS